MEYRSNAAAGFVLPPPTILPPSHGSGWPIAAIPEHPTKQEFDRISVPNNIQPLTHDDIPLHKMNNGGYRNEESPISPYDPSNSLKATQQTPRPAGNGTKTRPPRRSSANGVVACRQWYVERRVSSALPLTIALCSRARKIRCDSTRPGCDNCARRSSQCEYDAVPKRRGPDKRPGTRRRSCKKRPVDGEDIPSGRKRRKTETEDERSDGNDEIIRPSGEPSYHLSASPVPLVPNSALTINTEVSRDFFAPTSTGVRRSFPCCLPVLLTCLLSQSLPCRHRIAPQIKIRCGRQSLVRWISRLSYEAPNSWADPAPSFHPLLWTTPERYGGTIFLIRMHLLARKRTCPLPNPSMRPWFNATLGLRTSDLTYLFCKIHYAFNCNVR